MGAWGYARPRRRSNLVLSSWPPHGRDSRGSPQKCTLAQRLDGDAAELTSPHLGASSSGVSSGGEALARGATEWCLWRLGMLQEPRAPGTVRPAGAGALLLLADDHVRVAPVQPSSGMQRCQWRILPVPRSYLNRGWPLRLAALSSGGARVAVAGVRGVAVATLATERWRYLGASAAQLTPFRALFLHWLSDEALLVVACATPSIEQPAMTAAPLTTADGADIAFAVGNAGGAAAAAAAAAAFAIRTHGGSTADGQRLSLMVLRSDLREVLFRTEIGGPSPPRASGAAQCCRSRQRAAKARAVRAFASRLGTACQTRRLWSSARPVACAWSSLPSNR